MAETPDFYKLLQVDPLAEPEVIEAAYRRLAGKYHPDHNDAPDTENLMKQINEAYDVLSDPGKRADYDRWRSKGGGEWKGPGGAGRAVAWLRFLVPLIFLGMTVAGFRVNPRIGIIVAAAFVVYGLLRAYRRRL